MAEKKQVTKEGLAEMIRKGFENMDKRFNKIDKRFDQIEKRFDALLNGHKKIKLRLDNACPVR